MKAVQIVDLTGPDSALRVVDIPEPEASHPMTPGSGVIVDVHAAGVSFPELLQTRGEYQFKPPLPFVPGSEVGGVVRSAPEDAAVQGGRPRRGVLHDRGLGFGCGRAQLLRVPAAGIARLRPGSEPRPQLPHSLVRAEDTRPGELG